MADHLALGNFFTKLGDCCEERLFVRALEVLELLAVKEENEIWDCVYLELHGSVSGNLSVHSGEYKIWVVVCLCCTLISWLDSHARRASWAPEVNDQAGTLFN